MQMKMHSFIASLGLPEYWEEKCRSVAGEPTVILAVDAKTTAIKCMEQRYREEESNIYMDTFGERACRANLGYGKCVVQFFEDVSPCLHDGEAEKMLTFFIEINADIHNFTCSGSTNSWTNAFRDSNGYRCIVSNSKKIHQCQSTGPCLEILNGLIAHARGESFDSFESLFCGLLIEEQRCLQGIFHECGNRRAELLYRNYTEYLEGLKNCPSTYRSGSGKLLTEYNIISLVQLLILTTWTY